MSEQTNEQGRIIGPSKLQRARIKKPPMPDQLVWSGEADRQFGEQVRGKLGRIIGPSKLQRAAKQPETPSNS